MGDEKTEDFEDVVKRLEGLVTELESGGLGLSDALKLYEEGVRLARTGNSILEGVEGRILELQASMANDEGESD